jgi:hypothetical protein
VYMQQTAWVCSAQGVPIHQADIGTHVRTRCDRELLDKRSVLQPGRHTSHPAKQKEMKSFSHPAVSKCNATNRKKGQETHDCRTDMPSISTGSHPDVRWLHVCQKSSAHPHILLEWLTHLLVTSHTHAC